MCVCTSVCVQWYVCTSACAGVCVCLPVLGCVCISAYTGLSVHLYGDVCVSACAGVCVCVCVCTGACMPMQGCVCTFACTGVCMSACAGMMCVCLCRDVCMCLPVSAYAGMYACLPVQGYVCTFGCAGVCLPVQECVYTHLCVPSDPRGMGLAFLGACSSHSGSLPHPSRPLHPLLPGAGVVGERLGLQTGSWPPHAPKAAWSPCAWLCCLGCGSGAPLHRCSSSVFLFF